MISCVCFQRTEEDSDVIITKVHVKEEVDAITISDDSLSTICNPADQIA